MANERITIDFEDYEELIEAQKKLEALEAAGVDNWEGYSDAMNMYYGNN